MDEINLTGDGDLIVSYAVAAVDFSGNTSERSNEIQLVITGLSQTLTTKCRLTNAPNPVTDYTVIYIELSMATTVQLRVTDLAGKVIAMLFDNELSAGEHQIEFNRAGVAGGVYICQLITNEGIIMHKMMLR